MAHDPNDDVFLNIAKVMEELLGSLPLESSKIIGYTIITGPEDNPEILHFNEFKDDELRYELLEGQEAIYITVEIPPFTRNAPYADIQPKEILISVDEKEIKIELPAMIDIGHSAYTNRNGIIDIICKKL